VTEGFAFLQPVVRDLFGRMSDSPAFALPSTAPRSGRSGTPRGRLSSTLNFLNLFAGQATF
jgi:hypothetical protein